MAIAVDDGRKGLRPAERLAVAAVSVLAAAAAVAALGAAFFVTLAFFGDRPTAREQAIAAQAFVVALWSLSTPVAAWLVLRRHRAGAVAAGAWLTGWLATRPWAWPPAPVDAVDREDPLWWSPAGLPAWLLLACGLGVGLYAAHRDGRRSVLVAGVATAVAVVTIVVVSFVLTR